MSSTMTRLREILGEVSDLGRAASVLGWDQETYMPRGGVEARAQQLSTLRRLTHEKFTAPEVGGLLEELSAEFESEPFESDDASLVRITRRDYDKSVKLSSDLVAEIAQAGSLARPAWIEARRRADFGTFAPFLRRNIDLNKKVADAYGYATHPYDALLDRSEPDMTAAQLKALFGELKTAIVPLVEAIADKGPVTETEFLYRSYPTDKQLAFGLQAVQKYGYDLNRGRQDLTAHPFCTGFGLGDIRITTRVSEHFLPMALFGTMHESGHAMYEQGVSPNLDRTPLCRGASPGVHESQSRLWENLIGRSRAYWQGAFPKLQETFPEQLEGVDAEGFYRAVNLVEPSYIRVEADELTYNLHILLRFEMEMALLDGQLDVDDIPEAWDASMGQYLGITPPDDAQGCLQDIHWSGVSFGGFPGYTLGNIIGAQLFEKVREAIPDLDTQISSGEFSNLHGWLTKNLYQHGRKFTPNELLQRITGGPLSVTPWVSYAKAKFGDIYGV